MIKQNLASKLPPMLAGEELLSALAIIPEYDSSIRNADTATRLIALSELYSFYLPSQMSVEIYSRLYLALLQSLQKKQTSLAIRQQMQNYRAIKQQPHSGIIGGADSFTIIGASGIGKSAAISRAVSLITDEQIITVDSPYTNIVPCLTVQCPYDSSVKGLLLEILRKVDERLCSNYYENAMRLRATTDMLIGNVSQVALVEIGSCISLSFPVYLWFHYTVYFARQEGIRLNKHTSKTAAAALVLVVLLLTAAIALIAELLCLYFPGIWEAFLSGDQDALQLCLDRQDRLYSAGLVWLLTFVQVLSVVIPAMPVQLVAGMTFGTWAGFALSFSASIAANMTAYAIARRASKLLRCIAQDYPKVGKLLGCLAVSHNRTYYTVMALLVPGLPNGAIPYAAANSGIKTHMFLSALLIALPVPTLLTCAAGHLALSGDWLYSLIIIAVLYGCVAFLFFRRESIPQKLKALFHAR